MMNYRILTIMRDGAPGSIDLNGPGDLNAIEAFRMVMREHSSIITGCLFREHKGEWQLMMRSAR